MHAHQHFERCATLLTSAAGLKLALHAYQRHALAWMTWRERIGTSSLPEAAFWPSSSAQDTIDAEAAAMFGVGVGSLHPCWQPVTLPSGLKVFENRYTGRVMIMF